MGSWLLASCLTPCSSHLRGASLAHAVPALEPQPCPGPVSMPCLAPMSWRGVNSTEIPMWEACSAASGEQLVLVLGPGLDPSQERSQRGDDGDFGGQRVLGSITFPVEQLLGVAVGGWNKGEVLVTADQQDGPVSLWSPGPARLRHPWGSASSGSTEPMDFLWDGEAGVPCGGCSFPQLHPDPRPRPGRSLWAQSHLSPGHGEGIGCQTPRHSKPGFAVPIPAPAPGTRGQGWAPGAPDSPTPVRNTPAWLMGFPPSA